MVTGIHPIRAVTLGSHAVTPGVVTLYAGIYLW